jgi:hypothetical protein
MRGGVRRCSEWHSRAQQSLGCSNFLGRAQPGSARHCVERRGEASATHGFFKFQQHGAALHRVAGYGLAGFGLALQSVGSLKFFGARSGEVRLGSAEQGSVRPGAAR